MYVFVSMVLFVCLIVCLFECDSMCVCMYVCMYVCVCEGEGEMLRLGWKCYCKRVSA